jgi:hypothetical protein
VNSELFATLRGAEAGPEEGLAVSRTEKKITLRLYRGRLLVDSVDVEVAVETPHGRVEGKAVYFLVDVTRDGSRIVPIDGKLKVYPDLGGPLEIGPGETVTLGKGRESISKVKSISPEADLSWASPLESARNIVRNPGFERGLEDWTALRTTTKPLVHIDERVVFSGRKSARIDLLNTDFSDSSVPLTNGVSGCALYQVQEKLTPGSRYLFRFWYRTEGYTVDGREALFSVASYGKLVSKPLEEQGPLSCPKANGEWRCARFVLEVKAEAFLDLYFPRLKDPKSKAAGSVWIDDVALIPIPEAPKR